MKKKIALLLSSIMMVLVMSGCDVNVYKDLFDGSTEDVLSDVETNIDNVIPEDSANDTEEPDTTDKSEDSETDTTGEPLVSGDYNGSVWLSDYNGNMMCEVFCPDGFIITSMDDYSMTIESKDGYSVYVGTLPDTWALEYMQTGKFTKDPDFYSYEEVYVYDSFESEYGTVTILQKDSISGGFDNESTIYGVILGNSEESPYFGIDSLLLEEWNTDIYTFAKEIFQ